MRSVYASTSFQTCTVNEPSYFRKTPGGEVMTDVDKSSILVRSPKRLEVIEEIDGYKKVRGNYYSNNYTGWIASKYLTDFKTYTTDDNYANELRNAGFPESYILPLQKLHAIHPNWSFKVSKLGNGLNFNEVIDGEYNPVSKNLINSPYTALRSTDGAAYNNGNYTQFEPGWYGVSKQTLEFYIDSRNWLDESSVFMFEQLSFDSNAHTSAAVQKMLDGTFLSGSCGSKSCADAFIEAGRTYNVSPISLAARVIQEQGASGSATYNMKSDGQTYHNLFNVNATGSSTSEIVSKALATAKANGWTSLESSIMGGAKLISSNYIAGGQDTNYYQKFNTISASNLYWNQYMANVRVLPSESYNTYLSYHKGGKLDSNITFKIPVYNNMPDSTNLSISDNGDNSLKSLTVSNCSFNFYSSVVNYTCNVPINTNSVVVNASKASSYSSIKGTGTYNLNSDSTIVTVVVTAANGNQKKYNVTINKSNTNSNQSVNNQTNNNQTTTTQNKPSNNTNNNVSYVSPASIISSVGLNNRNNNVYGLYIGTSRNNLINSIKSKYSTANVILKNKYNSDVNSGELSTGDKIIIRNGSESTFTVVINGDPSGDGKIDISDLAMVKAKMLGKISVDTVVFDAADVNNDDKVDISDLALIKAHMLGRVKITK